MSETITVQWDDSLEAIEKCYELGWTDGLPVVPPTEARVAQFLETAGLAASHVVGELPERRRQITAGKVAANAVMAGCLPEYLPVVLAATEAMLDPVFNLVGPSSSMGGAAVLVMVNGPVTRRLNINSRNNLFGPGNRANATIGRAIRLILMNACAAVPGLFDRSVIGHPGKFTYCIAEADTETHWTPLHVERGFSPDQSAVTVFAAESPRQVRATGHPGAILHAIADVASSLGTSMSTSGSVGDRSAGLRQGQIVVTIAGNSGLWKDWSKDQVREHLHSRIRRSVADLKEASVLPGAPGHSLGVRRRRGIQHVVGDTQLGPQNRFHRRLQRNKIAFSYRRWAGNLARTNMNGNVNHIRSHPSTTVVQTMEPV